MFFARLDLVSAGSFLPEFHRPSSMRPVQVCGSVRTVAPHFRLGFGLCHNTVALHFRLGLESLQFFLDLVNKVPQLTDASISVPRGGPVRGVQVARGMTNKSRLALEVLEFPGERADFSLEDINLDVAHVLNSVCHFLLQTLWSIILRLKI